MIERNIKNSLIRLAGQYPVVTLTGPRQSGKTTLCQKIFHDWDYINLENRDIRQWAVSDPRSFLAKHSHRVIFDEIQHAPDLPSYLQEMIDAEKRPGQFVLTGSQQFEVMDTINQSLAGRTALLHLLPFSYGELYGEKSQVKLTQFLYTGFYPRIHDQKLNPTEGLSFYVRTYLERDLRQLINIKDLGTFERFLGLCAAQVGQLLNYSRLANDCGIDQKTAKAWLSLLQASYIIFLVQPHYRNFRKRLTKSPKLYFYDVGLAAYLLRIESAEQIDRHPLLGALFENFVIAELLKMRFNQVKDNNLYFFHDHVGHEVDLLLDYGTTVIPIEIKSGQTVSKDFFKGLNYYRQLNPELHKGQYLIYGGEANSRWNETEVLSFRSLQQILV